MSKENTNENKKVKVNLKTVILITMALLLVFTALIYTYLKKVKEPTNDVSTNIQEEPVKIIEFNEEDAINLLTQYLNERSLAYSDPQALLEKYSFATNQEFSKFDKTTDEQFIRTNIIYEDVRKEMQKYITKDFFAKQFKNIYKTSNGVTHVSVTKTPKETYTITREEKLESSTKQVLNVWYKTTKEGKTSEEKNMQVEYSKINGNWIISNIK